MNDEGGAPKSFEPHPEMAPVVACAAELSPAMRAVMLRHPRVRVLAIMLPNTPSKHLMHIGNVPEGSIAEVLRWALGDIEGSRILSSERMGPES